MESLMAAPPSETKNILPPTILSALQQFASQDALTSGGFHPFASNPEDTISTLRRLVEATNQAALSLNAHLSLPLNNPRLLSLYRQQASIASSVQRSEQSARHLVSTLRKRVGIMFGEDIPLERPLLVEWFLKRLLEWGASAGMEAFNDPEQNGRTTVVLGGKVLVVDIDFAIDRTNPAKPTIDVATLKTAYAIPNSTGESSSGNSVSLDGFLAHAIRAFLNEVQKDDAQRDSVEAARIGNLLSDHLSYLMKLDHLALAEGDGGLRWFSFIDKMSLEVEKLASREAVVVQKSEKGGANTPLDVFLLRAHALPLPYLTSPSISFLTYLSPLAYLKLLRTSQPTGPPINHLPNLDVPFHHLRTALTTHPRQPGMTIATLVLSPNPPPAYHADSMSMSGLDARTSTTLVEDADKLEFLFPAAREAQGQQPFSWLLDFTEGGKYPGVVMSQSRMRDIEMVVNPFGSIDHMSDVPMMAFGTGSWVDLLFNPHTQTPISPERYTALYTSPTSVHPPLQLRLNTPDEPGFILETIPVRTLKEVWSILEIVREQCWLNEILTSCQWVPEGLNPNQTVEDEADATVTEDDLQAVLKGHIEPRSIPVNIRIPQPVPPFSDSDMDAFSLGRGHARITMTTPERPPISGLVEITVTFDPGRARGVAVDITGAVGVDLSTEVLEEVCRRGGLLGLPGRVWMKAHQMP
ncbi:hypothetical protein DICSQDRAFT_104138 [Dichomitus squalens LYAD-421 SS1]|uniref:uncharacterized protein n=1 Tax=Dichomitus squalens (strain LYAD-421) TaxID=732165 RepID=UPI0004415EFB|nr:uncharacterized protein DICSQDRAFT_104138 [Dichomitus squalens LYAD-421 SS1]EJF62647.1 hypothetical protein DICSQDRAFT_104138 [Dichomitus squalens LYAD-421 SS1]